MLDFVNSEIFQHLFKSILVALVSVLVFYIVKMYIDFRTPKLKKGKRLTYLRLLKSICKYILILIAAFIILKINGVDTTSLLASLGIVSLIAGLALQDALKDIIMGFNIIADNYFAVGDTVKVNNITGKVAEIGLKATRIKNIMTGDIEVIANRNIAAATVISSQFDIDLPLPYEENIKTIEDTLNKIITIVKTEITLDNIEYRGVEKFDNSAIVYKLRLYGKPENHPQLSRDAKTIIKRELDKAHINIPYQQIEITNKK